MEKLECSQASSEDIFGGVAGAGSNKSGKAASCEVRCRVANRKSSKVEALQCRDALHARIRHP